MTTAPTFHYPSAGQGILPGLENHARHPMWSRPDPEVEIPTGVRRLREVIFTSLQPFDGRKGVSEIVSFVLDVYNASGTVRAQMFPDWLLAEVAALRYRHEHHYAGDTPIAKRNAAAIHRLGDQYVEVLAKEIA